MTASYTARVAHALLRPRPTPAIASWRVWKHALQFAGAQHELLSYYNRYRTLSSPVLLFATNSHKRHQVGMQRSATMARQAAKRFFIPVNRYSTRLQSWNVLRQIGDPDPRFSDTIGSSRRRQVSTSMAIPAPHSRIAASSNSERLAISLFDRLWDRYRERVSYVNVYEVRPWDDPQLRVVVN